MIVELAHRAAKQARLLLFRPSLSQPALLAEAALRVYFLARSGRHLEASQTADSIPRLSRVWADGVASPADILHVYRRWSEEAVLVRTAELEKMDLAEEDKRARRG